MGMLSFLSGIHFCRLASASRKIPPSLPANSPTPTFPISIQILIQIHFQFIHSLFYPFHPFVNKLIFLSWPKSAHQFYDFFKLNFMKLTRNSLRNRQLCPFIGGICPSEYMLLSQFPIHCFGYTKLRGECFPSNNNFQVHSHSQTPTFIFSAFPFSSSNLAFIPQMGFFLSFPLFLFLCPLICPINAFSTAAFANHQQNFVLQINIEKGKPQKVEEMSTDSLKVLANVCGEKPEPESPKSNHHEKYWSEPRRKKRNPMSDLIVSNLVSVITGSFTNDFTLSNFWEKLTFCFTTVFSKEHLFRGWKRCWEYWRLGEQKWRKALKPHIVANVHRLAAKKLKEADKGGRRYEGAMIQIQEEFNKVLMDGAQSVRMLNILREAGLQLPDLHWQPIQEQMDPAEMAAKIVEMDWHATSLEFHSIFGIYNKILEVLEKEFRPLFDRIENNKQQLFEESGKWEGRKIVEFQFGKENPILPNWQYLLAEHGIGRGEYAGKYLAKLMEWMGAELMSQFNAANQLFLHSVLANFIAQMLRLFNAKLSTALHMKDLSRCLLQLIDAKMEIENEENTKKQKLINKFGHFEGFEQKYLHFNSLNKIVNEKVAKMWEKKNGKNNEKNEENKENDLEFKRKEFKNAFEKFALNAAEKYEKFFKRIKEEKKEKEKSDDFCGYASGVLEMDIGRINGQMLVELDGEKLGMGTKKEMGMEEAKMVEIVRAEIQQLFYPNEERPKQLMNKKHIASRHGKAMEMSEGEMRNLEELLVLTNLAILGQIMASDLVGEKEGLGRIVRMMKMEGKIVVVKEGRPDKLKRLAEKMLEWMYKEVMKLQKSGCKDKMFDYFKGILNSTFDWRLQMSEKEHQEKFVRDEYESYRKKMGAWMEATLMEVENVEKHRAMGGPERIGLPMRLSVEGERRREMDKLGERTLVERTLKKMEYAKQVNQLAVMYIKPALANGIKNNGNVENAHPRKKRLVDAIFWGLVTGWMGNWISQYVDISKTIRNCFYRFKCEVVMTNDVMRKQREKAMLNFLERAYKILIAKLIELDPVGQKAFREFNIEVSEFLLKAVHAQGVDKHFEGKELNIGNILLELEILNFNDFRHHIEQIVVDEFEGESSQEDVILGALREFGANGWLHKNRLKNWEHCAEYHKRILLRIRRKECQREMLQAQMEMDGDKFEELMDRQWMGKKPFGGDCENLMGEKRGEKEMKNVLEYEGKM